MLLNAKARQKSSHNFMKLLFDQHLSFRLCARLKDLFPQSSQVRLLGLDTADDHHIWQFAHQNEYTIVTKDSDFGNLSILRGVPPKVIWLRCGNQPTAIIESIIRTHHKEIQAFEQDDSVVCLELY